MTNSFWTRPLSTALLALSLLATPALASEAVDAATQQRIRDKLTAEGWQVAKIKIEDGLYEAYARKGDEKVEIFLDRDLKIVRTKPQH